MKSYVAGLAEPPYPLCFNPPLLRPCLHSHRLEHQLYYDRRSHLRMSGFSDLTSFMLLSQELQDLIWSHSFRPQLISLHYADCPSTQQASPLTGSDSSHLRTETAPSSSPLPPPKQPDPVDVPAPAAFGEIENDCLSFYPIQCTSLYFLLEALLQKNLLGSYNFDSSGSLNELSCFQGHFMPVFTMDFRKLLKYWLVFRSKQSKTLGIYLLHCIAIHPISLNTSTIANTIPTDLPFPAVLNP